LWHLKPPIVESANKPQTLKDELPPGAARSVNLRCKRSAIGGYVITPGKTRRWRYGGCAQVYDLVALAIVATQRRPAKYRQA
jgi:hypothetical protein